MIINTQMTKKGASAMPILTGVKITGYRKSTATSTHTIEYLPPYATVNNFTTEIATSNGVDYIKLSGERTESQSTSEVNSTTRPPSIEMLGDNLPDGIYEIVGVPAYNNSAIFGSCTVTITNGVATLTATDITIRTSSSTSVAHTTYWFIKQLTYTPA